MESRPLIAQFAKNVHSGGMAELTQGTGFDLPDPFAGHSHDRPDFLKGEHSSRAIRGYPNASLSQTFLGTALEARYGTVLDFLDFLLHLGTDA